jgi:predicted RNA-binding Zn-ribbon protein involved in translation (DUF1610 family)
MPKCPNCKEEIDNVVCDRVTHIYQDVSLDENNKLDWSDYNDGSAEDNEKEEFYCPVCNEIITTSETILK